MELHSYAKRRASKKWNIEQKRKLVENRISHDSWFNNRPSNSVVPWKKVLSVAKLDDFNVFFVRKQWSNMLTKYKLYKQTRLDVNGGTNNANDMDIIQRINQEWEFFEAIHTFMTRKTTNLHSYAVTQKCLNTTTTNNGTIDANDSLNTTIATTRSNYGDIVKNENTMALSLTRTLESNDKNKQRPKETVVETTAALMKLHDCVKENIPNNATILLPVAGATPNIDNVSGLNHFHQQYNHQSHHVASSDTNEEFEVICDVETDTNDIMGECQLSRNTDHDFYSKNLTSEAAVSAGFRNGVARKLSVDERQLHYFADTSEESMGTEYVYQNASSTSQNCSLPSVMENIELHTDDGRTFEIKSENVSQFSSMSMSVECQSLPNRMPALRTDKSYGGNYNTHPQNPAIAFSMPGEAAVSEPNKMTERDKYYRHKRRLNRRLEKRFDAVLQVMGQVVKCEYPSVDIKPLMDSINSAASGLNGLLNSESDDDDDDDDDKDNKKKRHEKNINGNSMGHQR